METILRATNNMTGQRPTQELTMPEHNHNYLNI
jgi:hypothetical protein